uniref:Phosphoinositide-3-kinase interacting protein 1 n=1 Tax=Naja naja TaxID=35670 RepID=A0A8C6YAL9_NAJNA
KQPGPAPGTWPAPPRAQALPFVGAGGTGALNSSRLCPPGTWSTVSLHEPGVRLDDLQGTLQFLLSYASSADATSAPPGSPALPARTPAAQEPSEAFEPAGSESGAVRPVVGISQRVKTRPSEKKDLGTLGYVLGIIMVVVLIGIGVGIVLGYLYKRGKDLRERQEQKANEREMQRITLPLSAFSNPACELVEENVIVVHTNPTPVEEIQGNTPLMGQAGTPGA